MFKNIFLDNKADELELLDIPVQKFMLGKSLRELQLPDKYNVIVAGIIKDNKYTRPLPDEKFQQTDRLLVAGNDNDIAMMIKENN